MRLSYPVDEGFTITRKFGVMPQIYTISKGHNGVDWEMATGNAVYAMADGIVIIAEARSEKTGYGRQVRIKHPEGTSIYGHLSVLSVVPGEVVKAGELIGLSGGSIYDPCSGYSTGPHLHAEFRLDSGAPQVPGGYVYGAIDILPLLVKKEEVMRTEPFGIDVSSNNGMMDAGKVKAYQPTIRYAGIRDGISWAWVDPKYTYFKSFFDGLQIFNFPYHVLYPGEDAKRQANRMIELVGGDCYYYCIDIELVHGRTKSQIDEATRIMAYELLNKGKRPLIYSSPAWVDSYMTPSITNPPAWRKEVDWWLAQYLTSGAEHPGPVMLAAGVPRERVIIHQTSSQFDGYVLGQPYGSPKVDGNRWLVGTVPGSVVVPPETHATLEELETRVIRLESFHVGQ